MAFTVQDDTGLIVDANAYINVAFFDAYFTDLNNETAIDAEVADKQAAIIEATQYIDDRFTYKGCPLNSVADGQNTQFPRSDLYDGRGDLVEGLPLRLQQATAEYALRALSGALLPDPERADNGGQVILQRDRVEGAVETETRYAEGVNQGALRPFPKADRLLQQYTSGTPGGSQSFLDRA